MSFLEGFNNGTAVARYIEASNDRAQERQRTNGLRMLMGDHYAQTDPRLGDIARLGGDPRPLMKDREDETARMLKQAGTIAMMIGKAPDEASRRMIFQSSRTKLEPLGQYLGLPLPPEWSDEYLDEVRLIADQLNPNSQGRANWQRGPGNTIFNVNDGTFNQPDASAIPGRFGMRPADVPNIDGTKTRMNFDPNTGNYSRPVFGIDQPPDTGGEFYGSDAEIAQEANRRALELHAQGMNADEVNAALMPWVQQQQSMLGKQGFQSQPTTPHGNGVGITPAKPTMKGGGSEFERKLAELRRMKVPEAEIRAWIMGGKQGGKGATTASTAPTLVTDPETGDVYQDGSGVGEPTKPTLTRMQQDIRDAQDALAQLGRVGETVTKEYLTVAGRAKGAAGRTADQLGMNNSLVEFNAKRGAALMQVEQFFNQYRKLITGAAAAEKELAALREATINGGLGPVEFKSRFDALVQSLESDIKRKQSQLPGNVPTRTGPLDSDFLDAMNKYGGVR